MPKTSGLATRLPVTDLFFRSLFAFFIVELHSRRVIHVGVTRSPTDAWAAQQLREATAYGRGSKYLIRDRDAKFGPRFARVAATSGIKILKTPYHTPRAHAICERFLGSVRRECLDHLFILQEKQLHRVLRAYVQYFNQARPHQGIRQQISDHYGEPGPADREDGKILALPVLGGLHHDYREIRLSSYMLTTEQMVALCGAHLIKELAYLRSFLPSCTEKDNNREGMALPCENPEGNHVQHIRMMTLYSHERYSHEEVEEIIEEIKPSLFSADASSSQHNPG
ncbi:MAG TPA: integrase core domain-containing protein [Ktedonobacteraceae bacterium]